MDWWTEQAERLGSHGSVGQGSPRLAPTLGEYFASQNRAVPWRPGALLPLPEISSWSRPIG